MVREGTRKLQVLWSLAQCVCGGAGSRGIGRAGVLEPACAEVHLGPDLSRQGWASPCSWPAGVTHSGPPLCFSSLRKTMDKGHCAQRSQGSGLQAQQRHRTQEALPLSEPVSSLPQGDEQPGYKLWRASHRWEGLSWPAWV